MKHLLYRVTNLLNGRFYVGMHSTKNPNDGYLGSGKRIKAEIRKYGRENFKKEILETLATRISLEKREAEIVNEELLANSLCLNLKNGGEGNFEYVNSNGYNVYGNNGKTGYGGENLTIDPVGKAKTSWGRHREKLLLNTETARAVGVIAAAKANTKRKKTFADRKHQQGKTNSQFGTCWVTNGVRPIKIEKEQLYEYLDSGYSRGRKINRALV